MARGPRLSHGGVDMPYISLLTRSVISPHQSVITINPTACAKFASSRQNNKEKLQTSVCFYITFFAKSKKYKLANILLVKCKYSFLIFKWPHPF
jgi:hypothetical protein